MSRYYPGFTIDKIGSMSIYQFNSYLGEIVEVEKMLSGSGEKGKGKTDKTTTEELMKMAEKVGIKTPSKY